MTLRMGVKSTRGREVDGEEETGMVGEKSEGDGDDGGKKARQMGEKGFI